MSKPRPNIHKDQHKENTLDTQCFFDTDLEKPTIHGHENAARNIVNESFPPLVGGYRYTKP